MIKTGKSIVDIIQDISSDARSKVDKSTTVAGISLSHNIVAKDLLCELFRVTKEVNGLSYLGPIFDDIPLAENELPLMPFIWE